MSMFYFSLTNQDAVTLLKKEVSLRFPDLKFSYSRLGFITFKSEKSQVFNPYFARVSGVMLGKYKASDLNINKAWVYALDEKLVIPENLKKISEQSNFKMGEKVTLVIMVNEDEFWLGEYQLSKRHFATPGEVSSISKINTPSRAYYKIAEAFESFDLIIDEGQRILELGSSPGGASQFLLDQGAIVLGVDPAEMDPLILKNKNFTHLKMPFEHLMEEKFKTNVDWIISDINLPPGVVMKEVRRLETFLKPKTMLITLKMNQDKFLSELKNFEEGISKLGFNHVELKYLPSHRQEILLMARRS